MDRVTKEMFEIILNKLDKMDSRFDGLEERFDELENEVKEFRAEMKGEIKGLDSKIDMIYNKLNSDIKQKYTIVKED